MRLARRLDALQLRRNTVSYGAWLVRSSNDGRRILISGIMKHLSIILLCVGIMAGPAFAQSSAAELDRMIAAGRSPRELAQYLFDTHGCKDCHTIGQEGKLGFTNKGKERAEGFEGCISTLKAMSIIAKVPEDQRSATQRRRAQRFEEFGCAACHKLTPGKMGLTDVGAKLAHLHLGCVDVEKLLASKPASQR
jgi:cytochrome c2